MPAPTVEKRSHHRKDPRRSLNPPASTEANHLTAQALFKTGLSIRAVASQLDISPYTAWALKHKDVPDPSLVGHISKTIGDKLLLAASSATDALLDQALDNKLVEQEPMALAKTASICLQSAGAYAALSGASDMLGKLSADLGIVQSHSASRITLEQKVTVESAGNSPTIIDVSASKQSTQAQPQAKAKR